MTALDLSKLAIWTESSKWKPCTDPCSSGCSLVPAPWSNFAPNSGLVASLRAPSRRASRHRGRSRARRYCTVRALSRIAHDGRTACGQRTADVFLYVEKQMPDGRFMVRTYGAMNKCPRVRLHAVRCESEERLSPTDVKRIRASAFTFWYYSMDCR